MNVSSLRSFADINVATLPKFIREQYLLAIDHFQFHLTNSPAFRPKFLEAKTKETVRFCTSSDLLVNEADPVELEGFLLSKYDEGFADIFEDDYTLEMFVDLDSKVYEVFSRTFKILERNCLPDVHLLIRDEKLSIDLLSETYFVYGYEMGEFLKNWLIIVNNPTLFQEIFESYYGISKNREETDKMYFKVGLFLARGDVFKKTINKQDVKVPLYCFREFEFDSASKLAKHLGLARQYLNDSLNGNISAHNIFLNAKQMEFISEYCSKNAIEMSSYFVSKLQELELN